MFFVKLCLFFVVFSQTLSLPVPPGNPVANKDAQIILHAAAGTVRFTVLTPSLIRLEFRPPNQQNPFEDSQTMVIWNRNLPTPKFVSDTTGSVTTVKTESFELKFTDNNDPNGFSSENLKVSLLSPRLWMNVTSWVPGDDPALGNLYGTFHTLDGLEGWQSMNCTYDNSVWNGVGFGSQPLAHCAFGLISKGGWALVDDSRSPVLKSGWPNPQLSGSCELSELSQRIPCFQDLSLNNDSQGCDKAGCCYSYTPPSPLPLNLFYAQSRNDSYSDILCSGCSNLYDFIDFQGWMFRDNSQAENLVELKLYWNPRPPGGDNALVTSPPSLPGYTFVRSVGFVYSPSFPQPKGTYPLKLWYHSVLKDYFTTTTSADEERAQSRSYTFESIIGFINSSSGFYDRNLSGPVPPPPVIPSCYQRSGNIDWYLFTHGLDYPMALKDFASISGPVPMVRRHWLGVSWSRWGNSLTQEITYQQVNNLTNAGFPLSTYVFDMNWHLKPHWTGYTWDTDQYPNHVELLNWLHSKGLPVGANLHDAEGVMSFEKRYVDMARANGIDPSSQQTVLFRISNESYADTLNDIVLVPLAEEGIDFWWTDWQQGEALGVQDCTGLNPTMMLNHYRYLTPYGSSNLRGLIHSRWGGLGGHRYISGFGGDVVQSWESLKFMIYFTATATNVLFGYWGHEMMQLQNAPSTPPILELFTRVMQFGAFSPIYTNWGNDGCPDNLWEFPQVFLNSTRDALLWRLQLLPYRYTLSQIASETSLSIIRPMYYAYPKEPIAYESVSQYMLGDNLLVAPVTQLRKNFTNLASVNVWFPPLEHGGWYAMDDPTEYYESNNTWQTLNYPLQRVPVFVPSGTLLPLLPLGQASKLGSGSMLGYSELEIWVYPTESQYLSTWLYEDDGITTAYTNSQYANTTIEVIKDNQCLSLSIQTKGSYPELPNQRHYTVRILASAVSANPSLRITSNSVEIPFSSNVDCAPSYSSLPPGLWCTYSASKFHRTNQYTVTVSLPIVQLPGSVELTACNA